jgi:hypothetical protein
VHRDIDSFVGWMKKPRWELNREQTRSASALIKADIERTILFVVNDMGCCHQVGMLDVMFGDQEAGSPGVDFVGSSHRRSSDQHDTLAVMFF